MKQPVAKGPLFWTFAALLLCVIGIPPFFTAWNPIAIGLSAALDTVCICAGLGMYDPVRFRWAARTAAAVVFLFCVFYLAGALCGGLRFTQDDRGGTLFSAAMAVLAFGVPSGYYAVRGRMIFTVHFSEPSADPSLTTNCPACGKDWSVHQWARFASVIANSANQRRVDAILESLRKRDWPTLQTFQQRDDHKENLEVLIARCFSGGAMVAIVDQPGFCDPFLIYSAEPISTAELNRLELLDPYLGWYERSRPPFSS